MIKSFQRRTFTATALALGVAATLGTWLPAAHSQSTDDIKKKGELTVGLLVDVPPYGTMNSSNQPDGYDADVARLMAKDLGVKVNLVPVTGPNRIPFLLTNKVDLLVASLAITPERAKQVQVSKPYAAASIVVYGDKKAAIKSADDLKGKRVGVARASTQDVALTKVAPEGTEIRRFDDDVAAQIDKRATANTFENKFLLRQQVMAVAMRPGQDDLLKTVDSFVARNTANGELNKLYRKWLETDLPAMQ
jgi:polar amino acid transport system substrate-binding protein